MEAVGRVAGSASVSVGKALSGANAPKWAPGDSIPVAGIDANTAEAIACYLRSLPAPDGEACAADAWLRALQMAQMAHDRLLYDLGVTRRSLAFWQDRLRAGSHALYMLLNVGPISFARSVLASAGVLEREQNATEKMSQRIAFLQYQSGQLAAALAQWAQDPGRRRALNP